MQNITVVGDLILDRYLIGDAIKLNPEQPGVVIPIIGARRLSQLKDNLACAEFTLEPENMNRLNEVSRIDMGFPHDFFANDMVRQFSYGGLRDQIDNHRAG